MTQARMDDGTWIWRYFDFAKFVSLLDSQSLFFSAADQLEDPFEGALPYPNAKPFGRDRRLIRSLTLVNSWHINTDESFAMWRLYAKSPESVAIRTSVGRLRESLRGERRFDIQIRKVEYIDYEHDHLEDGHGVPPHLAPFLCKAKPYAYESEVRALIDLYGTRARWKQGAGLDEDKLVQAVLEDRGVYASADLIPLLESIYVSPAAGEWFRNLVKGILQRYGVQAEPQQSVLAIQPRY